MNDDELWRAMDRSIFGTNDPDIILAKVPQLEEELRIQNSSLGNYLRSLRESRRWEIDRIASEASVPYSQWERWERDLERPSLERINILARTFSWGTEKVKRLREFHGASEARIEGVS